MNGIVFQSFTAKQNSENLNGMVRKIRNRTQSLTGEKFQLIQSATVSVVGGVIRNTVDVLIDTTDTLTQLLQ